MKISEIFGLNKTQAQLDFVDIDVNRDLPLFLDPFFLGLRKDKWSIEATYTLRSFFQKLIELIRTGNENEAKSLFDYLHEENSTCLGMSIGEPGGKGVGQGDSTRIYDNILKSKAIQTGLIQDIQDNILFVDYFGKDKLSDMTTNIIKKHLIDYTIAQCNLHNIEVRDDVPTGFYWSRKEEEWITEYDKSLIIDEKPILLVPKGVVSYSVDYTPSNYYNHFVLNFLQNENIRLNSTLVQKRKDGRKYVTKADIKEDNPLTKDFLRKFSLKYPNVLEQFKSRVRINPLKNTDLSELSIKQLCKTLVEQLVAIPSGTSDATNFHNLVTGILELIFYPELIYPVKENPIHQGRKRIDITFDNASTDGIFYRLAENMKLPCQYIFIECKNYSSDPVNPELDQLSGRFSVNRGKVGFLLCRTFVNRNLFLKRCNDTYKDDRGLIIPLCDEDLINLLDNYSENDKVYLDKYLSDIIREITID